MQTQSKFSPCQTVFHKVLQKYCRILNVKHYEMLGVENLYEVESGPDSIEWVSESELEAQNPQFKPPKDVVELPKKRYTENQDGTITKDKMYYCQCGAWVTDFPNVHYMWCPAHGGIT